MREYVSAMLPKKKNIRKKLSFKQLFYVTISKIRGEYW